MTLRTSDIQRSHVRHSGLQSFASTDATREGPWPWREKSSSRAPDAETPPPEAVQDSGAGFGHPPCGDFPCGGPPSGQPSPLEHLCDCPPRIVNSGSGAYRSEHLQGSVLGVAPRRNCLGQILQSPKLLSDSSQTFPCPSEQSAARYPASKPLRRETDTSTTDWWSVPSLPSDLIASRRAVHSTRIALRQTQRTPSSYSDLASPSVFAEVGVALGSKLFPRWDIFGSAKQVLLGQELLVSGLGKLPRTCFADYVMPAIPAPAPLRA